MTERPERSDTDTPITAKEFFAQYAAANPEFAEAISDAKPRRQLASNIAGMRRHRGLTQRQLAEMVGVHQPAIARIENASSNPGWDTLARILNALQMSVHFSACEQEAVVMGKEQFDAWIEVAHRQGVAEGLVQGQPTFTVPVGEA